MQTFSKDNLPKDGWKSYRKIATTRAVYIDGPFQTKTLEGDVLTTESGYLAIDNQGNPYPIADNIFKTTYEEDK